MLKRLLRVKEFANKRITPLKLKYICDFGIQDNIKDQSIFLHHELPIRLAKRAKQLERLPDDIVSLDNFQKIHELYINSFERILDHPIPKNDDKIESFTNLITDIKKNHSNLELDLSDAIVKYRFDTPSKYSKNCEIIDNVLNHFYLSRIGIRFLIGQHQSIYHDDHKSTDRFIGMIDKKCNPYELVKNVIIDLENMFIIDFEKIDINIEGNRNIEFMNIPNNTEYILREIIKNSIKGIIDDDFKNPQINIFIEKGDQDILIKVSDRGVGFDRELSEYVFSYMYTSTPNVNKLYDKPILSGFAHGLGMSRLYARYLGGDIKVISSSGIGTDAFIHLKTIDQDENLK
jgi:pyruvate dehydrogenase kinase 2/3/4